MDLFTRIGGSVRRRSSGYGEGQFFTRILIVSAVLVLSAVVTVGMVSYARSSRLLLEDAKLGNILALRQLRKEMDLRIESLKLISYQISIVRDVRTAAFMSPSHRPEDIKFFDGISSALSAIRSTSRSVKEIFVVLTKPSIGIGTGGTYTLPMLYDLFLSIGPSVRTSVGRTGSFRLAGRHASAGLHTEVFTFVQSIPIGEPYSTGSVILQIDAADYDELLGTPDRDFPAHRFVIDGKGTILSKVPLPDWSELDGAGLEKAAVAVSAPSQDHEPEEFTMIIGHMDYSVLSVASEVNDWKYVALVPNSLIRGKTEPIRNFTFAVLGVVAAVWLTASYYTARRLYRPVRETLGRIQAHGGTVPSATGGRRINEFSWITDTFDRVMAEQVVLRSTVRQQRPILHGGFLKSILETGELPADWKNRAREIDLEFPFGTFIALSVRLDNPGPGLKHDSNLAENLVSELAERQDFGNLRACAATMAPYRWACILNLPQQTEELDTVHPFIDAMRKTIAAVAGSGSTIGIGLPVDSFDAIPSSWKQAETALKFGRSRGTGTTIHFEEARDIPEDAGNPYYPIEVESRIINLTKIGEWEEVRLNIETLFTRNRTDDPQVLETFLDSLLRTVRRIQSDTGLSDSEAGLTSGSDTDFSNRGRFEKEEILAVFETVTEVLNSRKTAQRSQVYTGILDIIRNRFHEDLSLTRCAEAVGYSPSYVSLIFRDCSGKNFIEFLQEYRMGKAKDLLVSTDLPVSAVGEQTGYANVKNFIRVFKKHEGVPPGRYRSIHSAWNRDLHNRQP